MPNNLFRPSQGTVKNLDIKFFNLIHFKAESCPAWLVFAFVIILCVVLWLVATHPLPAIVTGLDAAISGAAKKLKKPV